METRDERWMVVGDTKRSRAGAELCRFYRIACNTDLIRAKPTVSKKN